jgi:sulfur carrier protein
MKIIVNGDSRDIASLTLDAALDELGFGDSIVATALNGGFISASARGNVPLAEGDRVEIVAPMQGG